MDEGVKAVARRRKSIINKIAAAALAAMIPVGLGSLPIDWRQLAGNTAALSAMLMLPEGGAAVVKEHLAPEIEEDEPSPLIPDAVLTGQSTPAPVQKDPLPTAPAIPLPQEAAAPPEDSVPSEHRGTITQVTYTVQSGDGYIPLAAGYLKNSTQLTDQAVAEILRQPPSLRTENTDEPQVLIVHTHATEAFEPFDRDYCDLREDWRSTDNGENMVFVGKILAQELKNAGIGVIHDETQHDYPSYNGSYQRSAETISGHLQQHPTIRVVIDLHRDAIESPAGNLIKPVAEVEGEKAAQIMIVAGCDDGTMDLPNWQENLRWAAALQSQLESDWPGLTRPVFFCHRKYNMDLTQGSLLIEVGSHGNTLAQAARSARCLGRSMAAALQSLSKEG